MGNDPLNYLLKPVSPERLGQAFERLRELLREPLNTSVLEATIAAALQHRWRSAATAVGVAALFVIGVLPIAWKPIRALSPTPRDHYEEVVDREPRTWVVDARAVNALVGRAGLSPEAFARVTLRAIISIAPSCAAWDPRVSWT